MLHAYDLFSVTCLEMRENRSGKKHLQRCLELYESGMDLIRTGKESRLFNIIHREKDCFFSKQMFPFFKMVLLSRLNMHKELCDLLLLKNKAYNFYGAINVASTFMVALCHLCNGWGVYIYDQFLRGNVAFGDIDFGFIRFFVRRVQVMINPAPPLILCFLGDFLIFRYLEKKRYRSAFLLALSILQSIPKDKTMFQIFKGFWGPFLWDMVRKWSLSYSFVQPQCNINERRSFFMNTHSQASASGLFASIHNGLVGTGCKDWKRVLKNCMRLKQCGNDRCNRKDILLRMCKRCKNAYYCGKKHQKSDWKNHKLICYDVMKVDL